MTEPRLSLQELKAQVGDRAVRATLHAQVVARNERITRDQKPYLNFSSRDGAVLRFKIWNNHPFFTRCAELEAGVFIEATGEFAEESSGLSSARWIAASSTRTSARNFCWVRPIGAIAWPDYVEVLAKVDSIRDPRLRESHLKKLSRASRAAAARTYHQRAAAAWHRASANAARGRRAL